MEKLTQAVCQLQASRVHMEWIGGETLLAGVDFFEKALAIQRKLNTQGIVIDNAIQTNGTLLDDQWIAFFARHPEFGLSVSFDGLKEVHDRNRRTPNGEGTFEAVRQNLLSLQSHNVRFGILVTISSDALDYPARNWIDKLTADRFLHVGLQLDYHIYTDRDLIEKYLAFLDDLFFYQSLYNRSAHSPDDKLLIRESFYIYNRIRDLVPNKRSCQHTRTPCPAYLLSVDTQGDVYACCDAFLGMSTELYQDFRCGNILDGSFDSVFQSSVYTSVLADMRAGTMRCSSCDYFHLCNGGCGIFKFLESGKMTSGLRDSIDVYCMLQKGIFDFMLDDRKRNVIETTYDYLK